MLDKPKKICCDVMEQSLNVTCEIHADPHDCPDCLVIYNAKFREYGIPIRDGGSTKSIISYCPWCGTKLQKPLRSEWFDILEKLGFDDPPTQDIPEEFKSDQWWVKRNL